MNSFRVYCNDSANNLGNNVVSFTVDTTTPTITFVSPANTTYNNKNFNLTVNANEAMTNCSYSLNGAANITMLSINATAYRNNSVISIPEGLNRFIVYCNDTANNLANNAISFTVDTVTPTIAIVYPANTTLASQTNFTVNANEPLTNCSFMLDGAANVTMAAINSTAFRNNTVLNSADGQHNVLFYCNDSANNLGASSKVYYTIDTTAPTLVALSPSNTTYNAQSINYSVNANEFVTGCKYSVNDDSNQTMDRLNDTAFNYTSTTPDGMNKVVFYCNDTINNMGESAAMYFTVDTGIPTITVISPANTTYLTSSIDFNVSLNEEGSWCGAEINGTLNITLTKLNNTYFNLTKLMPSGQHNVMFYCNDTSGNMANALRYFTIITNTAPVVNLISVDSKDNDSYVSDSTPPVRFSFVDNSPNASCQLFVNGTASGVNMSVLNNTPTDLDVNSSLGDGAYSIYVNCTDYGSPQMSNVSATWYFTVDTISIQSAIQSPANRTYNASYSANFTLNYTVSEAPSSCKFSLNGQANTSLASCLNSTLIASQGLNTIFLWINDSANNWNQSNVSFTYDNISIQLALQSPQNITYSTTNITFNYTVSEAPSSCKYELNGANTTIACTNSTFIAQQGLNQIIIYVNDSAGNLGNSSRVFFTADSIYPVISLVSPTDPDNALVNRSYTYVNASLSENADWIRLEWNGANETMSGSGLMVQEQDCAGRRHLCLPRLCE